MFGPLVVFKQTPAFDGYIDVNYEEIGQSGYLIAKWGENAFEDHGDPTVLSYTVAIGNI